MTQVLAQKFSDLSADYPERMNSGFYHLDVAYGINKEHDIYGKETETYRDMVGLPKGRVTILGGVGGVGKSRLCLSIGLNMSDREDYFNRTVLYILNEDDPNNLRSWIKSDSEDNELYVIGSDNHEDHLMAINNYRPDLIVLDSLTGLEGLQSPNKIRSIMKRYKDIATGYNCHIILIAHLNKEGEIKGNTDLTYYPDHVCELTFIGKDDVNNFLKTQKMKESVNVKEIANGLRKGGFFKMTFDKNRGAASGSTVYFRHTENNVIWVSSCIPGFNY